MARTSTYLNFMGNTEHAFEFYETAFQTEFNGPDMFRGAYFGSLEDESGVPWMVDCNEKSA
jgi:uncharacterized glyoxalase superfamily protein PhnB